MKMKKKYRGFMQMCTTFLSYSSHRLIGAECDRASELAERPRKHFYTLFMGAQKSSFSLQKIC